MSTEFERAFATSDPTYDGRFVAAVRTTGIYCRPSCRVRKPLPKNVTFLPDAAAARAAGYRACLRCHPDEAAVVTVRTIDTPIGPMTIGATDAAVVLADFSDRADDARAARDGPSTDRPDGRRRRRHCSTARRRQLWRVFRRDAARLRPAARPSGKRVPGASLGRAAAHPLRRDDLVPRAGGAGRRGAGLARGGPRQRIEPAGGHHPCHRVIATGGGLGGYGGGLPAKRLLLELEGASSSDPGGYSAQ